MQWKNDKIYVQVSVHSTDTKREQSKSTVRRICDNYDLKFSRLPRELRITKIMKTL
jgi:hypothetical protein